MTGHLVLTTLHTTDCVSSIARLSELGVGRDLIASGTAAVIAQRLVRQNCPDCTESDLADPTFLKRLGVETEEGRLQHGIGCATCDFSGVHGRNRPLRDHGSPGDRAQRAAGQFRSRPAPSSSDHRCPDPDRSGPDASASTARSRSQKRTRTCYFGDSEGWDKDYYKLLNVGREATA